VAVKVLNLPINLRRMFCCFYRLALIMALLVVSYPEALAINKIDPELIPPDVTLSTSPVLPAPVTSSGSANGTSAPQPSTQAGTNPPAAQPQAASALNQPGEAQKSDPLAMIETEKGTILVRLFRKFAPKTVANFIELSNTGFYNGLTFHRVEPGFCIQGGDPKGDGSGIYFEPGGQKPRFLPLEVSSSLKHNAPGVVAMAHFPKNSGTSSCQFYITLAPQPSLDGDYSIFGGVINGMDVVNKIAKGDKITRITIREE